MRHRIALCALAGLLFAALGFPGCFGSGDDGSGGGEGTPGEGLPEFPAQPTFEEEQAAVAATLTDLAAALTAGDVEASVAAFVPEEQDGTRAWLAAHPDLLPGLAEPLAGATLTSLSDEFGWRPDSMRRRSAEVTLSVDGITFYVQIAKVEDRWLVSSF